MSRPAAVVITPEAPYPMHGGGAIRTASLLHYLSPRYDLDLILFRQARDSDPALSLPPGLVRNSWTITLPFHSRRPVPWLLRNGKRWLTGAPPLLHRFSGQASEIESHLAGHRYDLGLIEHFWCAPYVEQLAPICARTVLDLHNIESELHASCARSGSWPLSTAHARFARVYRQEEMRWMPRFSRLLCTSEEDAGRAQDLSPDSQVTLYPNALPRVPLPVAYEEEVIGFSANFEYHPNIAAVRFLMKEIWPGLAARFPGLKLRLIGKNPQAVSAYVNGNPRVEATGPVEDAIRELARVKVAIVPLVSGSGTRLKIIEAWAAARAVVATSIGAEGLGAIPGTNIVLADTPANFAASVGELLGSNHRRGRIGCAGRHTYEEGFTWEAAWRNLGAGL
jgi:glycosyltransferase involved in cell wall biosynthesis